jgi:predicted PhzF superfamily epimerase YddE/YHI9
MTYITGRPEWAPAFEEIELGSATEVEALGGPPEGHDLVGVWAWEDEEAGRVRVRVFAARFGVQEDEATGSHAVTLADQLGRPITIHQGEGSLILAEPQTDGSVEIGGRTELVEAREYEGG